MKVERDLVKVVIITENFKLIGDIHVVPGGRVTDFLASRVSGNFIPVTDVKVYSTKDEKPILETKFLTVNASFIILLYPLVENPSSQEL
ncbi:MAG: hypothetical protein AB1629_05275 [Candidatus Omnitrophota bacterium]